MFPQYTETSLRHPKSVAALRSILATDDQVHQVASTYPTWAHFAAASDAELAHLLGHRIPSLPATMPVVPDPPAGITALTRYQEAYPAGLRESATPPALLYVAGRLPDEPMVAVIGATNPTATGVEIARAAGLAAALRRVPLIAPLTPGCAQLAARTCLDAGGRVVIVVPHGFGTGSVQQALLDQVITDGGAVITPFNPHVQVSDANHDGAGALAVLAAQAVVLAEVGAFSGAAQIPTAVAVNAGRFLIVPQPPAAPESGRYIPPSAFGTAVFSSPREWSADYFGTSHRITQRVANGLAPADAVVRDSDAMVAAIVTGCAAPSEHNLVL